MPDLQVYKNDKHQFDWKNKPKMDSSQSQYDALFQLKKCIFAVNFSL